jgi:hypothetical protein
MKIHLKVFRLLTDKSFVINGGHIMRHSFKAKVDWDEVPDQCKCEYTGAITSCLPVDIEFKVRGIKSDYSEEFIISSSVCEDLESGYLSAEDFYNEMAVLQNI